MGLGTIILKALTLFAGLFIFNNILSVTFLLKIKTILGPPVLFRLHNIIKNITHTSITFTQYAQNIICSNNRVCYLVSPLLLTHL